MPFCSSCGSVINEGNKFCSKCGAPTGVQTISNPTTMGQQEITRKESLNELDRMIKYFSQKQDKYDEYDACNERISFLSNPKTTVRVNVMGGKPLKIIGIIMMAGCLPVTIFIFFFIANEFGLNLIGTDIGVVVFVVVLMLVLLAGGTLLVLGILKNSSYMSEQRKQKAIQLADTQKRLDELGNELIAYYQAYGYCAVSSSYTNPKILATIRDTVWSGRADTIKEAINVMIQDAHYSEMELQATLTANSAASAARGAKAAAFFSAANFVRSLRR